MPLGLEAGAGGVLSATIFQQHQQQHNQNANATYRYSGPVASGSGSLAGVQVGASRGHSRPLPAPAVPTLGPGQGPVPTARRASAGLASLATNLVTRPSSEAGPSSSQATIRAGAGRVWPPVELDDMDLRMGFASASAAATIEAQHPRMLHRNMFTSDPGTSPTTSTTTTATVQQPPSRPTINVNVYASTGEGSGSSPMTARPISGGGSRASGASSSSPMRRGATESRGEEDTHMMSP